MARFRVQVDALTGAVKDAKAAKDALDDARDEIGRLTDAMDDEPALRRAATSNHIEAFAERWRKEFELIGDMVVSMNESLTKAAEAYEAVDTELADLFEELIPESTARTSSADSIDRPRPRTTSADASDRRSV